MVYKLYPKNITFSPIPTVVFVDYECWRYGLLNKYKAETDVFEWFSDLKQKGQIEDILFFGDFTTDRMKNEVVKIRNISNNIIDCTKNNNEKEFADFIILDHIYQRLIKYPNVKQIILFSGDGHFQSVVAFLRNFNEKIVGVYSVAGTLSEQLSAAANWYVEISPVDDNFKKMQELIISNLKWAENQSGLIPTFKKTVDVILKKNPDLDSSILPQVLGEMIANKLIMQTERITVHGNTVRALQADWQKINDMTV